MNANGSPVTGPVQLKLDLYYSGDLSTLKCSKTFFGVPLKNGVFHVNVDYAPGDCGSKPFSQIVNEIPNNETMALSVTDVTHGKTYSHHTVHAVPLSILSSVAKTLTAPPAGTPSGHVLKWNGSAWEAGPDGSGVGTVTGITAGTGINVTQNANDYTVSIANGNPNEIRVNDATGAMSSISILPLGMGGTGANSAGGARTNLGLGTSAVANVGFGAGNVLPATDIAHCLPGTKLNVTALPTVSWTCTPEDSDNTKLPLAGGTMTGAIDMGTNKISNLGAPTLATDAATKAYVDSAASAASTSVWSLNGSDVYRSLGQVGIGTNTPQAVLDVSSTTSGVLVPRMTTAQRDAIASPLAGMVLYNTSTNKLNFYDTAWKEVGVSGAGITSINIGTGLTPSGAFTSGGTIAIAAGGVGNTELANSSVTDAKVAGGISRSKLAAGTANQVVINDATGAISSTATLPMTMGGTGLTAAGTANQIVGMNNAAGAMEYKNIVGGTGVSVSHSPNTITLTATGAPPTGAAGGDLSGTYPNPTLNTVPVSKGGTGLTSLTPKGVLSGDATGTGVVGTACSSGQYLGFGVTGDPTCYNVSNITANSFVNGGNSFGANATLGTNDNFSLNFETNNTSRMTILGDGSVGIGTTTPTYKLQVNGDTLLGGVIFKNSQNDYDSTGSVNPIISRSTTGGSNTFPFNTGGNLVMAPRADGSNIVLATGTTTPQTRMIVSGAGNVGIGTTAPTSMIDVNGSASFGSTGKVLISSAGVISSSINANYTPIVITNPTGYAHMVVNNAVNFGSGGTDGYIKLHNNSKAMFLDATGIKFNHAVSTEAMRINTSGNLGIGTTVPNEKLTVSGMISLEEGTAPTATANFGKIYVKSADSKLYFMNDSGVETALGTPTAGSIDSSAISDGSIVDADVSATAAIAQSKIANLTTDLAAKQPLDAELTAVAGLSTDGIMVKNGAGSVITRTIVGAAGRTFVSNGNGATGNPTVDISNGLLPSPVAGDAGKFLKASGADTSSWQALASGDITTALGFTPLNKTGDSTVGGVFDFTNGTAVRVGTPVGATDAANKSYVDSQIATNAFVNNGNNFGGNAVLGTNGAGQSLSFETAGTTKMTITSDGKVGVGMSNPTYNVQTQQEGDDAAFGAKSISDTMIRGGTFIGLRARGTAAAPTHPLTGDLISQFIGKNAIADYTWPGMIIWAGENQSPTTLGDYVTFYTTANGTTSSTEKMRITGAGNVGIGTTSPGAKLDVNGKTIVGNGSKTNGTWPFYISDSSNLGWKVADSAGLAKFELYAGGGVDEMRLLNGVKLIGYGQDLTLGTTNYGSALTIANSTGFVGIGNTAPTTGLEVNKGSNWTLQGWKKQLKLRNEAGVGNVSMEFDIAAASKFGIGATSSGGDGFFLWHTTASDNTANASYLLTAKSTGLIGLGTSLPNERLTVEGVTSLKEQASAPTATANYGKIYVKSTDSKLYFMDDAGTETLLIPGTGSITSTTIQDGTIVDADVSASAAIAQSKIANLTTDLAAKQSLDAELTAVAGLATDGIMVKTGAGTVVTRTIAGTANRLSVTNGDGIAGNPTINIDTNLLPSPAGAGNFLKSTGANTASWQALASGDITTALGFTPINKTGDTIPSGVFDFTTSSVVRVLNPIGVTDVANKQYVDGQISGAANQWTASAGNVYRSTGNVGIGTTGPITKLHVNDLYQNTTDSASGLGISVQGSLNDYGGITLWDRDGDPGTVNDGDTTLYFGDDIQENLRFAFKPSGGVMSEKMRITSSGNVGIGTTTPGAILQIGDHTATSSAFRFAPSADQSAMRFTTNASANWIQSGVDFNADSKKDLRFSSIAGNTTWMTIQGTTGNLGVGTVVPSEKLEVAGNVKATAYLYTSDQRLKENVKTLKASSEKVLSLRGVEFDWKENGKHEIGFIAQEVEKVEPSLVVTSGVDGMKSVKYANIVALLVEAYKDHHKKIEENQKLFMMMNKGIDTRVKTLEREVASLKEENQKLKQDLELIKKHLKLK